MEAKTISESFGKLNNEFYFLSLEIKKMIEERLGVIIDKEKRPYWSFEWVIKVSDIKATLRLYANGNLYVCKHDELSLEEKIQFGITDDYSGVGSNLHGLDLLYDLTDEESVEQAIKALKAFFCWII